MHCPACGFENRDGARFCVQCGARLELTCPGCGSPYEPGERFCGECGAALTAQAPPAASALPSPPAASADLTPGPFPTREGALEGERRQLTVLFCDLVSSTALSTRLDPEELRDLVRTYQAACAEVIERYEGHIAQYLGDGLLVYFGYPASHGDDAQRAARAGLGMVQAVSGLSAQAPDARRVQLEVRIGIHTGLVVVGEMGGGARREHLALGEVPNVAARLQALAEPGTVVISGQTHRLIGGYFLTRDLGEQQLKGKQDAVGVHEVLSPNRWRSRVDAAAERGLSPFVGRDRELETLVDRFARARSGKTQFVFVRGEAGIGKSRLLYELKRRLEGEDLTWLEGRCISYGQSIPYLPLIDILKDSFQIEEADTEATIVQKLERGVGAMGAELGAGLPYLKYMLSVNLGDPSVATLDPQRRKGDTFEALRALTVAGAAIRPLVMVVEDIHWLDQLSEEWLSYLADTVQDRRILLVLSYRPGTEIRFGSRPFFTQIELESLSEQESSVIAGGLLGADALPPELQGLIFRKAEGNPLFVEEVAKSLEESGAIRRAGSVYVLARPVEEIHVPDSLQDVIMARLDRLPSEPRRAIQTASVIGREFTVRLLERTAELHGHVEEYLHELKSVELIYERSLYPELAYMFKHALTHDVAYSSLLVARRRALHRLVGDAIETLYADRLAEHYETLAYHFERAEQWDKALDYLQKSGSKALASFAPKAAVEFYDRALAVVERLIDKPSAERIIGLYFDRGRALFLLNDLNRSIESFQEMLQSTREAGDRAQEGEALHQLGLAHLYAHRFEDAIEYADLARDHATSTSDQAVLAGSLVITAVVRLVTGELVAGRSAADEAVRVARANRFPFPEGLALCYASLDDHWRGDDASALAQMDEAIKLGREHQLAFLLLQSTWVSGLAHCNRGEYNRALAELHEVFDLAARLGHKFVRCKSLNSLGWVYIDLCNWELAIQYNAQGAAESRAAGDPEIIRNAELNLGDCYLALGQLDESQRYLETVERESLQHGAWGEEWMKWRYTQHMNASLGELRLARGDPEKALTYAGACLEAAEATESRRNIVKGRRLRGQALLAQVRLDEAGAELEEALRVAREVGNPAQIWKTLTALGDLRGTQGRAEDAVASYREALAAVDSVAAGLEDTGIRDTLLASPQVMALRKVTTRP